MLKGRIALVTGPRHARSLTLRLASGGATVVVAMRAEAPARAFAELIAQQSGNPHVHAIVIDLASLASVRRAAAEFIARYQKLHVLVTDTTEYPGPFLLAHLLLDTMKGSGNGRVVRLATSHRHQIWSATGNASVPPMA